MFILILNRPFNFVDVETELNANMTRDINGFWKCLLCEYVSRNSGNSDCYTGWSNQDYMEAWEPTAQEQAMITYTQRMGTDNGVDQTANLLSHKFTKRSVNSSSLPGNEWWQNC